MVPTTQLMHAAEMKDPVSATYLPAAQLEQTETPIAEAYMPIGQFRQTVEPVLAW